MLLESVRIRLLLQQIFYDSNKTECDNLFISFEQRVRLLNLKRITIPSLLTSHRVTNQITRSTYFPTLTFAQHRNWVTLTFSTLQSVVDILFAAQAHALVLDWAAAGSPITVGSPVTAVRSMVAEVVGSPISVGPPGAAIGSVVGSMVTVAGAPVAEIFGSAVTGGSPIVAFATPVAAVDSPIVVGLPVTFGPPVIEIGMSNVLLFYVAPDIWRNFYVKLVLYRMYGT